MTLSRLGSKIFSFIGIFVSVAIIFLFASDIAFSQQSNATLERRVEALENYVATIQPTLAELSDNLNSSIRQYTNDLESGLEAYSGKLQKDLDRRLDGLNRKAIVLNPFSKAYQTIQTNTGTFLIAVERVEPIERGVRLHLNIGNPNYADYQNFKLKFFWGRKRGGEYAISYDQWRQSLRGVEFTFNGRIERGKWNAMTVDLVPVDQVQFSYLECEMNVSSIELEVGGVGYD